MAQARYGDADLKEFKALIEEKLEMAREDLDQLTRSLSNIDSNNTNDTAASFKLMEDGSETMSKEETAKLATRQEKFVESLENALMRIRNKTYGLCRVTGKLIQKERLKLVPHATLSIEAKRMQ
ncbi:MAG: TraR/DksA family transcriptional regulator [Flavobacteriales bacterium]|jgi:DnaK suppressor protein|tara:strand:- start:61 stop:432 length:372 start_codon:yes stop_codon:yes gene_type:complete